MPAEIITDHHCVPHSFDGAGNSVNLSRIRASEHRAFHDATGHAPPDFFLRRFLIGSVSWQDHKDRSLPPGMYQDVLALLTPDDWHTLYQPGTFIETHDHSEGESLRRAKAAFHLAWYLDREMSLIMDQIGLLGIHKLPPFGTAKEMQRVHQFFAKGRPHVVMRKFLLDTTEDDSLKWAKPMREDIRKALLDVLRLSKLERLTSNGSGQRIFDLLLDHHERLVNCTKIWEPNLRDHAGTLKRLSQQS
ncbi:MAG: hypothetical protein Q7S29_04600 [Candidatus Peribacter sp.]|nr:hypothetical protein [Candidatus Peribacter sp.]